MRPPGAVLLRSVGQSHKSGADQRYFPGGFNLSNTYVAVFVQLRIAKVKPSRKVPLISTLTSLLNKAMPLIRYEIGDIGKICINEKDDYILELLSGRKLNYILLENGEKISPYIFPKIIEQINDELGEIIIQFQIIQLNIRDFLIYFVLNPQMSNWSIAVKNKFVNYMNFTKFKNVNWEIKFLKNIYPDFNTGKLSFFINKLIGE